MSELVDLAGWEVEMARYATDRFRTLVALMDGGEDAYQSTVLGLVEALEAFNAFPCLAWWKR
jgi:hypothetical protein